MESLNNDHRFLSAVPCYKTNVRNNLGVSIFYGNLQSLVENHRYMQSLWTHKIVKKTFEIIFLNESFILKITDN